MQPASRNNRFGRKAALPLCMERSAFGSGARFSRKAVVPSRRVLGLASVEARAPRTYTIYYGLRRLRPWVG